VPELIRTSLETLDDRRVGLPTDDWIEKLYTGTRWSEGPAYLPAGRYLIFSDIPNDRMLRYDELTGAVGVFRSPAGFANGSTVDPSGRLVTCEHGNRRVTRTEHDGSVTVLADRYDGHRFNSPNDVVVKSDGSVWFTDPPYGLLTDYQGQRAEQEIDGCHVYRIDPSGRVDIVADDFVRPNGLAFSADESRLFVADTRAQHIRVFDVDGQTLHGGDVFAPDIQGGFDGMRLDTDGRVWAVAGCAVHIIHPDGTLLGKLTLPEPCSNLTFGGPRKNTIYITGSSTLYSLMTGATGL
jgi:gluconolactonase